MDWLYLILISIFFINLIVLFMIFHFRNLLFQKN